MFEDSLSQKPWRWNRREEMLRSDMVTGWGEAAEGGGIWVTEVCELEY